MSKLTGDKTTKGAPTRTPASISALIYEIERQSNQVVELVRQMRSQLRTLSQPLAEPALSESSYRMRPEHLAELMDLSVRQVQRILKANPELKLRGPNGRLVVDAASFEIKYAQMPRRKRRKTT